MSRYRYDIYSRTDLPYVGHAGTKLVEITDQIYLAGTGWRQEYNGTGSGQIVINRHNAACTSANFADGNYVLVVDTVLAKNVAGFFLPRGTVRLLSHDEAGAEDLTINGQGSLAYLGRAIWWHESFAYGGIYNGKDPRTDGQWYWQGISHAGPGGPSGEQYGDILHRAIDEAQANPNDPIPAVTISFGHIYDSSGGAWDSWFGIYRVPIGRNYIDFLIDVLRLGLTVQMTPLFQLDAYQGDHGTDRSSGTFASGKVRFEGGVNIASDLDRSLQPSARVKRILVRGQSSDPADMVVVTDGAALYESQAFVEDGNVINPDQLAALGAQEIVLRGTQSDIAVFPILVGNTPLSGVYVPSWPGDGGHFWLGDLATIHTGTGALDYNEEPLRVAAISATIDEAGNDIVQVELGATYTDFSRPAIAGSVAPGVGGCTCPSAAPACTSGAGGFAQPEDGDMQEGATGSVSAGVAHTIPWPTNMVVGEMALVFIGSSPPSTNTPVVTLPGTLTSLGNDYAAWVVQRAAYRIWTGTEGSTFTVTQDKDGQIMYRCYRISNVDATTPPEIAGTGHNASIDPPVQGNTPSWGSGNTLWIASLADASNPTVTHYPTSYPGAASQVFAGSDGMMTGAYAQVAAASSPSAGGDYWGVTLSDLVTYTVAVRGNAVDELCGLGAYSTDIITYGPTYVPGPSGSYLPAGSTIVPPTATQVPFTPTGTIAATDVQAAIAEVAIEAATTFGTPAIVLGTSAAAGSTNEVIRRDSTIVAFDATAPVTQAYSDAAATGSAAVAARRDHKHGMPATSGGVTFGTPAVVLGTAAAAGSIDEVIRRDSTIVAFDGTAPVTQAFSDSAATGSATVAARRDHKHGMPGSGGGGGGSLWGDSVIAPASSHADDDEFDDNSIAGAWTQLDDTPAATWTEKYDVLSVLGPDSDAAAETHDLVKSLSSLAVGDYIECALRLMGTNSEYPTAGILFANGATYGAGEQAMLYLQGGAIQTADYTHYNTRNSTQSVTLSTTIRTLPWMHLRLTYQAANTWRGEYSPDGVSWLKIASDLSKTLTPTHGGLFVQSWTSAGSVVATFEYFRRKP